MTESVAARVLDGARPAPSHGGGSYRAILHSSAMIGGAAMINVIIGMVRTKILAVLLGPAGYGLMGAYLLIGDVARNVAQVGLNSSGVRQIADAAASGRADRIAATAAALRYTSLACGLVGALVLVALSGPISRLTFGDDAHAGAVALLALALLLSVVAGWQGALLQGLRRIAEIAKIGVIGAILGTICGVPLVYVFRTEGLVPMLVVVAASSVAASWWYCRKLQIREAVLDAGDLAAESALLLKLGLAFAASGVLGIGAAYAVRVVVTRLAGLEAAGIYYAAWTLGGLYVGFILQALGSDFYPRLVGVASDDSQCNRLVNEQAQVSLLLATPGVLATLSLAPLIVSLFYSAAFAASIPGLRWICLGMALRVLTWPIGFIVVAKNRQVALFAIELAWALVNVGLTWLLVRRFGVDGAGTAFFVSYICHGLIVYCVARRLSGFRWSPANRRSAASCGALVAIGFCAPLIVSTNVALAIGLATTLVGTYLSARDLTRLAAPQRLPRPIAQLLRVGAPR